MVQGQDQVCGEEDCQGLDWYGSGVIDRFKG